MFQMLEVPLDWREFDIPKKSGGKRHICAPNADLKKVQRQAKDWLEELSDEQDSLKPTWFAHGFVPYRDTTTGLQAHNWGTDVFLCMDVSNFFDNMPIPAVETNLRAAGLPATVVDYIIQHGAYKGRFPQGSPCSPLFMNIGMRDCDYMIAAFAKRHGFIYTRYADDMTLSRDPNWTGQPWTNYTYIFEGINTITRTHVGLELKKAKSHVIHMHSKDKQQVNGIVVNQNGLGLNAPKRMRRKARAMAHNLYLDVSKWGAQKEYFPRWGKVKGYVTYMDHIRSASRAPEWQTADPIIKETEWNYLKEAFAHERGRKAK